MIDKNANYVKYFLEILKEFDESTVLNPDLSGIDTPSLNVEELKIDKKPLDEFCQKNSVNESVLFLAGTGLALNKFNFSSKNLIFHENDIIFTTYFENRKISGEAVGSIEVIAVIEHNVALGHVVLDDISSLKAGRDVALVAADIVQRVGVVVRNQ